jgi:hypothetical protein
VTFATRTTRLSLLFLTISSLARPQGLSPGAPSKEYIRQGSQIIAIESPRVQFITFGAVGDQIAGTPFTLSASASSGLALSYTSSTPSVCTVSTDAATFIAAGTYTITAEQSGNATYPAAPPVSQSFNVVAVVSAQVTSTGFAYSRVTQTFDCTFTITNGSSKSMAAPLQLVLTGLSSGVTVANASGSFRGNSYLTASGSALASGASVSVAVQFSDPTDVAILTTAVVYTEASEAEREAAASPRTTMELNE